MKHMNEYDLDFAQMRFYRAGKPNRLALALAVQNLAYWTDEHSDGWAYWPPPKRAAQRAIALIESTTNAANAEQEAVDITDELVQAAVRPIKAFLTRQQVPAEQRERILRAVLGAR